jgi:hypothetical protein
MIKNGFYSYGSKALDGVDGGDSGVMVLRAGGILGGTSFFYFIGTYSCSGGRWRGHKGARWARPIIVTILSAFPCKCHSIRTDTESCRDMGRK